MGAQPQLKPGVHNEEKLEKMQERRMITLAGEKPSKFLKSAQMQELVHDSREKKKHFQQNRSR